MRVATLILIPLSTAFLMAQAEQTNRTETHTSTTFNGVLVDAGCRSTHIEKKVTTTIGVSRQTEITKTDVAECPVTSTTSSFGLVTPDGRYVRFDQTSNTRINEIVKNNKDWNKNLLDRKPINVRVVGSSNGDVVVMQSIR